VYTFLVDMRCAHHYTTFQNHNQIVTVVRHRLKLLDIIDIWVCIKKNRCLRKISGILIPFDTDHVSSWNIFQAVFEELTRNYSKQNCISHIRFLSCLVYAVDLGSSFTLQPSTLRVIFFTLLSLETTLSLTSLYRDRYRMSKKQKTNNGTYRTCIGSNWYRHNIIKSLKSQRQEPWRFEIAPA